MEDATTTRAGHGLTASPDALATVAGVLEGGGIAAVAWGHPRRATYALLVRADDPAATRRLNRIKGRPSEQVLAVVGAGQVADRVADLTPASAVSGIAAARGVDAPTLLGRLFATGPVALMLDARASVPPAIAEVGEDGRARVLVVGQATADRPDDFYDVLVDHLAVDRGVLLAGSSGNRSGQRTYNVRTHRAAESDLGPDVDVFVRPPLPLPPRRHWDAPVSCTGFDLTTPDPTLIRHGSLHPAVFAPALGRFGVSPSVERIGGRQSALAGLAELATMAH